MPEQVDMFTRAMMARIFRTMPNIAGLVTSSLLAGDNETAKTAMQNLEEEMGGTGKTHQQLAEDAFNVLREAYSLPRISMKQAHDDIPLPESYTQEQIWVSGYKNFPAIASWLQETASGGNGGNHMGMMADLFQVFSACQEAIGVESFRKDVLPYFASHIKIDERDDGRFYPVFDKNAVEYLHGVRAEKDAMQAFAVLPQDGREKVKKMALSFLDAQSNLFLAIQSNIEPNASGGITNNRSPCMV